MDDVFVEKIIPGGQSIGTLSDGKKIFFWNALPGEIISEYTVTRSKSSYVEAIATGFKKISNERIDPVDECFLSTSPWQNMTYDFELLQKSKIVQELFRQNGISIDVPEVCTDGCIFNYRNKMEYALYYDKELQKILLAFHGRGSHAKIPIIKSSIERPELFKAAKKIVDELNAKHEEARKYQSLLLRCSQDGKVSGGLFENGKPHPVFEKLSDTILGNSYSYSPNGFFQINLPVYEMALREMSQYIISDKVLDLYSGVGTIGLSIARNKELTLVECNGAAYEESVVNSNSLSNVKTVLAKSEDVLEFIENDATVILDPPRAGCDKKLIEKLLEVRPKRIIYLSCNPATQARDVAMLVEKYQIIGLKAFNFFPRTPHIENLVVLE